MGNIFLIVLLMIPTGMNALLINDRESRQTEAVAEVSGKWGGPQTITGPVLIVSNHLSNWDPPLVGTTARPRRVYFMAKKSSRLILKGSEGLDGFPSASV